MQDKSINGALLALRKQIIRGKLDGLANVEALMAMRGADLPRVMPAKRKDVARKGHMTALVLEVLRDGSCHIQQVNEFVASKRPELNGKDLHKRTRNTLDRLRRKGLVVQDFGPDGCLWRLD